LLEFICLVENVQDTHILGDVNAYVADTVIVFSRYL